MITSKQRAFLRSLAHHLEPQLYIGKQAVTENVIKQTNDYLHVHELMKCSVQQNLEYPTKAVAQELAEATHSEIVQIIGRKFTLYKRNPEKPIIELP